MIKVAKLLWDVKSIIMFMVIHLLISFLFVNTLSNYFNTLSSSNKVEERNVDLKHVVFLSSLNEEEYTIIFEELSENAELYYYQHGFGNQLEVVFDSNLVSLFESLGYVKIIDKNGQTLTSKNTDNTYGTCKEITFKYETYSCSNDILRVDNKLYDKIINDEYLEYADIFTSNMLIDYEGDLKQFIEDTAFSNGFEVNIQVYDSNRLNSISDDYILTNTKMEKQNIIAVIVASILLILLTTIYYLTRKTKIISILLLLGYSRVRIVCTILMGYSLSLLMSCSVLIFNHSLIVLEYFVVNMSVGIIVVNVTLCILRKLLKDKAREKL